MKEHQSASSLIPPVFGGIENDSASPGPHHGWTAMASRRSECHPRGHQPSSRERSRRYDLPASRFSGSIGCMDQVTRHEIFNQGPYAELPGRSFVARPDPVDERAEFRRSDCNDISALVGEAAASALADLRWSEHRAQEEDETVRILMGPSDRLLNEVFRVATDLAHGTDVIELKSILTLHMQRTTSDRRTSSSEKLESNNRMNGPRDVDALLSFAFDSSRALRPSKSRRFTSLPSVAPTIFPLLATTSTTSGSGLFHADFGWMPISAP